MKVFAVRDKELDKKKDLAYLLYYENNKQFYIELPDDADPWETPLLLSSFASRGDKTVNAYWSKTWVQQRIVPPDRQNIGQVLKDNGLSEYDEYKLLMLTNGRCAQDSCYLVPVDDAVPETLFKDRYEKKIEDIIPLENNSLLILFRNGKIKRCDIAEMAHDNRFFKPILSNPALFNKVSVQTGGYGICWGDNITIPDHELYNAGIDVPISKKDLLSFISHKVISTADAAALLGCSRQNINELVLRGKLKPVKVEQKNKFFLKSDIQQRLWK